MWFIYIILHMYGTIIGNYILQNNEHNKHDVELTRGSLDGLISVLNVGIWSKGFERKTIQIIEISKTTAV